MSMHYNYCVEIRHGVIVIDNRNQLQSITGFLVIAIAIVILMSACHVIGIKFIAKVIAINDYCMITAFGIGYGHCIV